MHATCACKMVDFEHRVQEFLCQRHMLWTRVVNWYLLKLLTKMFKAKNNSLKMLTVTKSRYYRGHLRSSYWNGSILPLNLGSRAMLLRNIQITPSPENRQFLHHHHHHRSSLLFSIFYESLHANEAAAGKINSQASWDNTSRYSAETEDSFCFNFRFWK
jgi:hypothetical protein